MLGPMLRQEQNGLPILRFASLAGLKGVGHAVTTRHGGVSQGPHASLNLGLGTGDSPEAVAQNLETVRQAFGLSSIAFAKQVHGTDILTVGPGQQGKVGEADGLATDQPGVGLLIKQADCQAIILVEPERRVVANLHAGWRGNVADMAGRGVAFLEERFGVDPARLWAAVSPSLGPCCGQFVNHASELPPSFGPYRVWGDNFDLWQVTVDQLTAAGVPLGQIEMSAICTRCAGQFYSYRREGVTGRFGTLVWLEP